MSEKIWHIERDTIQETLVIPLYARKLCTERYPFLFQDHRAEELMKKLDYDFSSIANRSKNLMQQFGALEVAMRHYDLSSEVRTYLNAHPHAAVVNLGCGLDQTAESCDNGRCAIYNVDLPDVIAIRNQLLPPEDRVTNIAADLTQPEWSDKIDASKGVIFFASGVFYYFQIEQIKLLLNHLAQQFPGGVLAFDTAGKKAVQMMMKTFVKQADIQKVHAFFYVNHIDSDLRPWLRHANISSRGYMMGYHNLKHPSIPAFFRLLAKIGDRIMKMQIIHLDFVL